jgi:hypothetical protein
MVGSDTDARLGPPTAIPTDSASASMSPEARRPAAVKGRSADSAGGRFDPAAWSTDARRRGLITLPLLVLPLLLWPATMPPVELLPAPPMAAVGGRVSGPSQLLLILLALLPLLVLPPTSAAPPEDTPTPLLTGASRSGLLQRPGASPAPVKPPPVEAVRAIVVPVEAVRARPVAGAGGWKAAMRPPCVSSTSTLACSSPCSFWGQEEAAGGRQQEADRGCVTNEQGCRSTLALSMNTTEVVIPCSILQQQHTDTTV